MKSIKHIVLLAVIAVGVFGAVLYTSCKKDNCRAVACLNGGNCSGGICTGCPSGVVGNNCETICESLFVNTYTGFASIDSGGVFITDSNNILTFTEGPDSQYTTMNLTWQDPKRGSASFIVTLTTFACTTTGSNFTLSGSTIGGHAVTGTGSVNSTTASLTLQEVIDSTTTEFITLSNFNAQH